jgi:hypothetical protein
LVATGQLRLWARGRAHGHGGYVQLVDGGRRAGRWEETDRRVVVGGVGPGRRLARSIRCAPSFGTMSAAANGSFRGAAVINVGGNVDGPRAGLRSWPEYRDSPRGGHWTTFGLVVMGRGGLQSSMFVVRLEDFLQNFTHPCFELRFEEADFERQVSAAAGTLF